MPEPSHVESTGVTEARTGTGDGDAKDVDDVAGVAEVAPANRSGDDAGFGAWGWFLLGLLVLAFVVVPVAIVLVPPTGLPFLVAYLALPLVLAVGLGLVAVWSALRSTPKR